MDSLSEVEFIDADEDLEEMFERDIEEVQVATSSEEDKDPDLTKKYSVRTTRRIKKEKFRKSELYTSYDYLQKAVMGINNSPTVVWKRTTTLKKALILCDDLANKEQILGMEAEELLQENWKLKKLAQKLKKVKKRKPVKSIIVRRASSSSLIPTVNSPTEKRRVSMDDSTIQEVLKEKADAEEKIENKEEIPDDVKQKKCPIPRKKKKRATGLSEEEKEFYLLEDKIEDLLIEVDSLWNEIKDDEEVDETEEFPKLNSFLIDTNLIHHTTPETNVLTSPSDKSLSNNANTLKSKQKLISPEVVNEEKKEQDVKKSTSKALNFSNVLGKAKTEVKDNLIRPSDITEVSDVPILDTGVKEMEVIAISDGSDSEDVVCID